MNLPTNKAQTIRTKETTSKTFPRDGLIGKPMPRVEDTRLLRGQSRYVSDIALKTDAFHVAILRSPHAHATIRSIDATAARAIAGVVDIITADDLNGIAPIPCDWAPDMRHEALHPVLAADTVRYVGEPVAAVIATTKHTAQDALEAIQVDYAQLPVLMSQEAALVANAPRIHNAADNVALHTTRTGGNYERAKREAEIVIKQKLINNRCAPTPMEGRAVLSQFDSTTGRLTHHTSSQLPHVHARALATCLNLPLHKLQLIAPDVGGGFGAKLGFYAEDVIVALASQRTMRACVWVQSRTETMLATTHGRDHVQYVELTANQDGTITGLKAKLIADIGAYAMGMGPGVPAINTGLTITGPYQISNIVSEVLVVYTNRMPTGPYRGAGHPEATFLIERMVDNLADELNLDPAEIRRKNFVPPTAMPYKVPIGLSLDSGDYAANLTQALEIADYTQIRQKQAAARKQGRYIGIGIATYAEISGAAPSLAMPAVGFRRAGHESARVVMHADARVTVFSGAHSHGQGHATSLAQIAGHILQVPLSDIEVIQGDTAVIPFGTGTYNSRTMAVGGSAVYRAAERIRNKLQRIAAVKLQCRAGDLVYKEGCFVVRNSTRPDTLVTHAFKQVEDRVKGTIFKRMTGLSLPSPERGAKSITLVEIAHEAHLGHDLPLGMQPGLDETDFFDPTDMPAAYATHIAIVEVEPDIGHIGLQRHIIVDDGGTIINPLLAAGQVHGGAAQGIGQALMEHVIYDETGALLTDSLMGYAIPRATDLPTFETAHTIVPTNLNPLGAKGIGEGATIGAPPAIVNAVLDALRPLGVTDIAMPLTPERVWEAIEGVRTGRQDQHPRVVSSGVLP